MTYVEDEDEKDPWRQGTYTQCCEKCGLRNKVVTQADDEPEYYTEVYTYCYCGHELRWDLPVN